MAIDLSIPEQRPASRSEPVTDDSLGHPLGTLYFLPMLGKADRNRYEFVSAYSYRKLEEQLAAVRSEQGERRYSPDELLVAAQNTLFPVDQRKREALCDLIYALKQPDNIPPPQPPDGKERKASPSRKRSSERKG